MKNIDKELLFLASQYDTIDEMKKHFLFHGTNNDFDTPLKGGGYDGVAWTARTPDVAQNYIVASGSSTWYSYNDDKADKMVNLNIIGDYELDIVKKLGYEITLDKDEHKFLWGYSIKVLDHAKGKYPTNKDMAEYIEKELGYSGQLMCSDGGVKIRLGRGENGNIVLPDNYRAKGKLHILHFSDELNLFDMSQDEGDLQELQYHNLEAFAKLDERKYDGVIINDFAQSDNWGNFGHKSVGLFKRGVEKCDDIVIDAYSFDWGDDYREDKDNTPEFSFTKLFEASRNYKKIEPIVLPKASVKVEPASNQKIKI